MDKDTNLESSPTADQNGVVNEKGRVPFGVWLMGGIFGVGLIVLMVMSNIDF